MNGCRKIRLADPRGRDAVVALVNCTIREEHRFRDAENRPVRPARLIKATERTRHEALLAQFGGSDELSRALIDGDPEVDLEACGREAGPCDRVFLDSAGKPLYAVNMLEVIYGPDGAEKLRRPLADMPANINGEMPLRMSKKLLPKLEAARRFAFTRKYQVRHVDGLTFDFLFGIAEHLHQREGLAPLGAGPKGDGPLIMERNGNPYRGFLEGRIQDDSYLLALHLASFELCLPEVSP